MSQAVAFNPFDSYMAGLEYRRRAEADAARLELESRAQDSTERWRQSLSEQARAEQDLAAQRLEMDNRRHLSDAALKFADWIGERADAFRERQAEERERRARDAEVQMLLGTGRDLREQGIEVPGFDALEQPGGVVPGMDPDNLRGVMGPSIETAAVNQRRMTAADHTSGVEAMVQAERQAAQQRQLDHLYKLGEINQRAYRLMSAQNRAGQEVDFTEPPGMDDSGANPHTAIRRNIMDQLAIVDQQLQDLGGLERRMGSIDPNAPDYVPPQQRPARLRSLAAQRQTLEQQRMALRQRLEEVSRSQSTTLGLPMEEAGADGAGGGGEGGEPPEAPQGDGEAAGDADVDAFVDSLIQGGLDPVADQDQILEEVRRWMARREGGG